MFVSIAPLDIELAGETADSIPVGPSCRRTRVLARWSGVPVGIVEVPVQDGGVAPAAVLQALAAEHPHALVREAVRRALLQTGSPERFDLARIWDQPASGAPSAALTPRISVAVCTRDRTADLITCLEALTRLDPPPFEILVVDNAPASDATFQLLRTRFSGLRYVCEPQPGLDRARNRAVAETGGDIIAFTDDDAVVDPGWLRALSAAFAADPAVGLVTGLAEPLELETKAQILFERYGGFGRGCRRTYSQVPRPGSIPWTLVGAGQLGAGVNMAVRREVFTRIGLFDPALDVGTPTLGGGDHDLFFRVLHDGWLCVYEPTAVVRHRHRRTMQELRRLLFSYGHGTRCFLEREELNFPATRPAIRRLYRWWWRHWAWARWSRAVLRPAWFPADLVFAEIKGFWQGRGAYARARRQIVKNESTRPDAPHSSVVGAHLGAPSGVANDAPASVPAPADARLGGPSPTPRAPVGIVTVDVAAPLTALELGAHYDQLEIIVQWQTRPLGVVRIASRGQPVSARRLADEISHALWHRLLEPLNPDTGSAVARFAAEFAARSGLAHALPPSLAGRHSATVVVTTCNRPDPLRRCLQSLSSLRTSRALQILVVDNRPDAGSVAEVVRDFPTVELISEPRAGSSYARNAGIAAARGEFIAMVDDDMTVTPDWLERLLAPFSRADVVAVTGNTLPARLETHAERMLEVYGGFCRGFLPRIFDSAWFHRRRWRAVPTWQIGGSGNAAFRREIFSWRAVGRFAETLGAGVPTGVGEDTKLFYDILHAGFAIAYEPAAVAWHFHRVTMPGLRRQLFGYSKGHVAYHLTTLFDHGDGRALVRILAELPLSFAQRAWQRLRGRSPYPWRLLATEMIGTLLGPWSLWRAQRLAKRLARQHGAGRGSLRVAASRLLPPKQPALEVSP